MKNICKIVVFIGGYLFTACIVQGALLRVPLDYSSIQAAIDASITGDEIVIANGTYTGTSNKNLDFAGKSIVVRSEGGNPDSCIIDCELNGRGFVFENSETIDAKVKNIQIRNGYMDRGAAIYISNASPTIDNCLFLSNEASSNSGGAIYCLNSESMISKSVFTSNVANRYGGGIYASGNPSVTIDQCAFNQNQAGESGGGISVYNSESIVSNCVINSNEARNGGGIYCYRLQPEFLDCEISGNQAEIGAGVYTYASYSIFYRCLFESNEASSNGGAIRATQATPQFTSCVLYDNSGSNGGGVYSDTSNVTLANCLILENDAAVLGGGVYFVSSISGSVQNCTFSGNTAALSGGGLYSNSSSPTITDSILWSDSPNEIFGSGSTVTYSDIQGGYSGTGNINSDPLFTSGSGGYYYLSQQTAGQGSDSPCLDTGSDLSSNIQFPSGASSNIVMSDLTTRTDQITDLSTVDMGYHYSILGETCDLPRNLLCDSSVSGDVTGKANDYDSSDYGIAGDFSGGDEVWKIDLGELHKKVTLSLSNYSDDDLYLFVSSSCPPSGTILSHDDSGIVLDCATGVLFVFVDHPSSSPGSSYDLQLTCSSCVGDTCADPFEMNCGECLSGVTTFFQNDHGDCSGGSNLNAGPDAVIKLTVNQASNVVLEAEADFNADYAISTDCDDGTQGSEIVCENYIYFVDDPDLACGEIENPLRVNIFTYTWQAAPGDYYIWIDGHLASDTGHFAVEVSCVAGTPTDTPSPTSTPVPSATPTDTPFPSPTFTPYPGTYHTITVDGTNDFASPGEKLGNCDEDSFWLTWDENRLYLGFNNFDYENGDFFVYLDINGITDGSDTTDVSWNSATHNFPDTFKPDYYLAVEDFDYNALRTWNGTSWNVPGSGTGIAASFFNASGFTEIAIDWSSIGNPEFIKVLCFEMWENDPNVFCPFPTENPDSIDQGNPVTFTHYFLFDDLGAGVFPSDTRYKIDVDSRQYIQLNEILPDPGTSIDWNGDGTADETDQWLELYLPASRLSADLEGCYLNNSTEPGAHRISEGTVLWPDQFRVFYQSEPTLPVFLAPNESVYLNDTQIVLDSTSDSLRLLDLNNTTVIDSYEYLTATADQTWRVCPDGSEYWEQTATTIDVSPGTSNNCIPPTVTPVPSFTPTPEPTHTPTATATETGTPTSTPTATSSPIPTNTPSPTFTPTFTAEPTFTPTNTPLPSNTPTSPPTNTYTPSPTHTPIPTNTPVTPSATPNYGPVQINIEPECISVASQDTFSLEIWINASVQMVNSYDIHIDFDPNYLSVNQIVPIDDANWFTAQNEYNNTEGMIDYAALNFMGTQMDFIGCQVEFTALSSAPETLLDFVFIDEGSVVRETKAEFEGVDYCVQNVRNGMVSIDYPCPGSPTETPTPEPTWTPEPTSTFTPFPSSTPTETPTEYPTEPPTETPTTSPTPIPTITPTNTPDSGILRGFVELERPGAVPPHNSWIVNLEVTTCAGGIPVDTYTTTTDDSGYFTVDLPPGTFDILVTNAHTLANRVDDVEIVLGMQTDYLDFGTLREGNANGDNIVNSTDFFILRAAYNTAPGDPDYNENADFNQDLLVSSTDFFLMRAHYNEAGVGCDAK